MTDPVNKRVEEWFHKGVRTNEDGKRYLLWTDGGGSERRFTGRETYVTGGIYEANVSDHAAKAGSIVLHGTPTFKRRHTDSDLIAGWRAAEAAAEAIIARKAAERKAARRDALDEAMAPLRRYASTLRTGAERDGLAAHIIRTIAKDVW